MTKSADFREANSKKTDQKQKYPVSTEPEVSKQYKETVLTYKQILDDDVLYEAIRNGIIILIPDQPDS